MGSAQYYYLNDSNKPQGPFTIEQMAALMLSGAVTQETKVALAGDANWKPLSEQPWVQNGQVVTGAGESAGFARGGVGVEPGQCPKCSHELTGWTVPHRCPSCGYRLRPASDSFWAYMMHSLRRMFSLRGRATRKEYWAFCVAMIPVTFLWFFLLLAGIAYMGMELFVADDFDYDKFMQIWPGIGMYIVVLYAMFCIPWFFLYGRRFHDLGLSAWWGALILAISIGSMYLIIPLMQDFGEKSQATIVPITETYIQNETAAGEAAARLAKEARDKGDEALAQDIMKKRRADAALSLKELERDIEKQLNELYKNPQHTSLMILSALSNIFSTLAGLAALVIGFIDSKRGPNKYGPSIKYPRG
ncbi:MAG: DUF805 domain-containing protein [Akkermansia sp.]|nr:DUF805 domain-containing protein [Akkermansia sp.]